MCIPEMRMDTIGVNKGGALTAFTESGTHLLRTKCLLNGVHKILTRGWRVYI